MSATPLERIAQMSVEHYRGSADYYIRQTEGLGRVLWNVIQSLGLKADIARDVADDDVLLFGMYRASDVVAAVRHVHTYKGEGLTACGLEVVGPCPDCERAT